MKRPPVTISLGKSTQFAAKDTTPGHQMSSLEDIHALIKDEALNQHHEKRSPFSNESLDLVQMDEEMMPKNSQSPESPPGFKLKRSASPIFTNAYDATGERQANHGGKQRYASAVNTSAHQIQNRFSTNSIFNTSGLNQSTQFIPQVVSQTDPTTLQQQLTKE